VRTVANRRRNGLVLLATYVAAFLLTRAAYRVEPGSGDLPFLALVLAAVLVGGTVLSGGLPPAHRRGKRPLVRPALTGLAVFLAFLVVGWVARLVPAIDRDVREVLALADSAPGWLLAVTAVAAGMAEEAYYRGALFERLPLPVVTTAAAHALATLGAANLALTGAAVFLGLVCGLSRRASGGWWAPAVTHATWAMLMMWFTPR
jgi:hypothetical protein